MRVRYAETDQMGVAYHANYLVWMEVGAFRGSGPRQRAHRPLADSARPIQFRETHLTQSHNLADFSLQMVPIYENYKGYSAPDRVQPIVSKLLAALPHRYLSGLRSVVLTNSAAMTKGKTKRVAGRKHLRRECLGFYYRKSNSQPAWIELVVDNILAWGAAYSTAERDLTENAFASVLFHEIGHHLDYTVGAPAPSGEAAANAWKRLLLTTYWGSNGNHAVMDPPMEPSLAKLND